MYVLEREKVLSSKTHNLLFKVNLIFRNIIHTTLFNNGT